jgi:hypothetical protein
MAGATAGAIAKPDAAHLQAAAVELAPGFLRGPLERKFFEDEQGNAYPRNVDKIAKATVQRTDADKLFKSIGLTGIHESTEKAKDYQSKQLTKAYADYRTSAMVDITNALLRNNTPSEKAIAKYFQTGQGDPNTFLRELDKWAFDHKIPARERDLLFLSAGKTIPQIQALIRRTE